jgi:hypothetical protein
MNEQNTPTNSLGPIGKTGLGPHPVGEVPKLLAGVKYDEDKPDYSLLPANALNDLVRVLTYGARKYDRENWRKVPDMNNRYFAAAMRHMWALRRGELFDPETGIHHAAHAMCSMAFICEKWYEENIHGATPDEDRPGKLMEETEAKIFERLADKFSHIAASAIQ